MTHSGATDGAGTPPSGKALARTVQIVNKKGLHARASAKFVQTVERFQAAIKVTRGAETVGGDSIMGLMMLSASPGTSITIEAAGPDAEEALAALESLVSDRFGEEE
jgi:phosphocarrier protein